MTEPEAGVSLNFKGGGTFVKFPPVFSNDGEDIFVAWKNTILKYNVKTGKLLSEFKGVDDRIIGFGLCYFDSYECVVACTGNGHIAVWKVITQFKILTKKLEKRIHTFNLLPLDYDGNSINAFISYDAGHNINFAKVNITNYELSKYTVSLKKGKYLVDVASKFVVIAQNSNLLILKLNEDSIIRHTFEKFHITCLVCHPEEETVLVGEKSGRCILWQGILSKKPSRATFHWHTLPVQCVTFSKTGSFFYSGGEECVVVKCQTDNNLQKNFLPRLPSGIKQISVSNNNQYIAIGTTDNGIRIVDSRFNTVSVIQHLVIGNHYQCGILSDPRSKALIMNGTVGQIQFYNPHDMSLYYKVEIVNQNKITKERDLFIENFQVTKIAISKSGLWMATIEERKDLEYSSEIRLKFWKFDTSIQNFSLNTSIEYPHEKTVTNMLFQPTNSDTDIRLVTVGKDHKYKIWQLVDVQNIHNKQLAWKCFGVGFYRDLPCKGLSFSMDGTLFAVGFGSMLTTWLPDTCDIKCSLVHPQTREDINFIEFGRNNLCHLIVTASKNHLNIWNLLTLSMVWTVRLNVALLVSDPTTVNMAVITQDRKVFVFAPNSSEPIYKNENLLQDHSILTAAFINNNKFVNNPKLSWCHRSSLFFIDSDKELFSISAEEDEKYEVIPLSETTSSAYSLMLPKTQSGLVQNVNVNSNMHMFEKDIGHKTIKKYLDAPLHTMVPIRINCASLLKSMVVQKESFVK